MTVATRPAPRVPAGPKSLAASAANFSFRAAADRLIRAIEPWYDWGHTFIERVEARGEGPGYFVSLQWLGMSFTLFFGRTPKAVRS